MPLFDLIYLRLCLSLAEDEDTFLEQLTGGVQKKPLVAIPGKFEYHQKAS